MGRSPCSSKEGLNRGAWTALEDKTLTEYIKLHGEGKWRSLTQKAGLKRCGKSCRLRWLNYLRPGIKRGNISLEEEDLIIRLHKLLGNRWSLIAGRLPCRTDNEIKNYWNTSLSKKANTSSKNTKTDSGDKTNKNTHESHKVTRTKAIKFTKTLFTPQPHQIGPIEPNENFVCKSAKLSLEEEIKPTELKFNDTMGDDSFLLNVPNLDFSGILDFDNGNDNSADELNFSSDGSLIFSKDLIENWTENSSFLYRDMASPSYENFTNLINSGGDLLGEY